VKVAGRHVTNVGEAAWETHWVDLTVLSVRSLDVAIPKIYPKLSLKVRFCQPLDDTEVQTRWAVTPFHLEVVRQANASKLSSRQQRQATRAQETLSYLSRPGGESKSTIDMGATYLELDRQADPNMGLFARLCGAERAMRVSGMLLSSDELQLHKNHAIDQQLWARFAGEVKGLTADTQPALGMPPWILHPHGKWKLVWDWVLVLFILYTIIALPYQGGFGKSFLPIKYSGNTTHLNPVYVYTQKEEAGFMSLQLLCNRPPTEKEEEKWALFGWAMFGGKCSIEDVWFIFHNIMDFCFLIDVILSFRLAVPNRRDLPLQLLASERDAFLSDGATIALRYMRGWFLLDLVSALPVDLIMWAIATKEIFTTGEGSATGQRVLYFVKLCKVKPQSL
jgi:hypothetical protein